MNILDTEIPSDWLEGATLSWITSVSNEVSDSMVPAPVARRTRPLMQITFDVWKDDVATVENLYITCNGPANGFFARPPIERYYTIEGQALGTATGSAQIVQFSITRGQTWDVLYPVESTIVLYANGVEIDEANWELEEDGSITVTATVGQAITGDCEYKTPFQFVDEEFEIDLQATFEMPKSVTIREIP